MGFSFQENQLAYDDTLIFLAPYLIKKILPINDRCFILMDTDEEKLNENVWLINKKGETIWKVPQYDYVYDFSPFIDVEIKDGNIRLTNLESSYLVIDNN